MRAKQAESEYKGWKEMTTVLPSGFLARLQILSPGSRGPSQHLRAQRTGRGPSNRCPEKEDAAQLSTALLPDTTNDVLRHALHSTHSGRRWERSPLFLSRHPSWFTNGTLAALQQPNRAVSIRSGYLRGAASTSLHLHFGLGNGRVLLT